MRMITDGKARGGLFGLCGLLLLCGCGRGRTTSQPSYYELTLARSDASGAVQSTAEQIRNRLFDIHDSSDVEVEPNGRVRVLLSNSRDLHDVLIASTRTGAVDFRLVDAVSRPPCPTTPDSLPSDAPVVLPQYAGSKYEACYRVEPPILDGSAISMTQVEDTHDAHNPWVVDIHLAPEGSREFETAVQHQIAIVVDKQIQAAPYIVSDRLNGIVRITGEAPGFSEAQARLLGALLSGTPLADPVVSFACRGPMCP